MTKEALGVTGNKLLFSRRVSPRDVYARLGGWDMTSTALQHERRRKVETKSPRVSKLTQSTGDRLPFLT